MHRRRISQYPLCEFQAQNKMASLVHSCTHELQVLDVKFADPDSQIDLKVMIASSVNDNNEDEQSHGHIRFFLSDNEPGTFLCLLFIQIYLYIVGLMVKR